MKTFDGKTAKNARIKIDYSGKKPNVFFSYPDKKNQSEATMFPYILFVCFILGLILMICEGYGDELDAIPPQDYYEFQEYYYNNLNQSYTDSQTGIRAYLRENKFDLWMCLIFFIILPPLIYSPFKKKWNKLVPKFIAKLSKNKFMEFKSKDVIVNGDEIYCEVPLFKNVMLRYNAQKDFSKQLKYFEIEEYKYYTLRKPTKKNKKKRELNDYLWYARFYFKQKPTTGKILVEFH